MSGSTSTLVLPLVCPVSRLYEHSRASSRVSGLSALRALSCFLSCVRLYEHSRASSRVSGLSALRALSCFLSCVRSLGSLSTESYVDVQRVNVTVISYSSRRIFFYVNRGHHCTSLRPARAIFADGVEHRALEIGKNLPEKIASVHGNFMAGSCLL